MENSNVIVENLVKNRVVINVPDLNLKRTWEGKGVKRSIPFDIMVQAIYEPGVENLFKQGILYIDNMEQKIALGLEEEGTTEPTNIVVIDDNKRRRLLTVSPIQELKAYLKTAPYEQIKILVDYAIANEVNVDFDRCEILKKLTGTDIIDAIRIERLSKEA